MRAIVKKFGPLLLASLAFGFVVSSPGASTAVCTAGDPNCAAAPPPDLNGKYRLGYDVYYDAVRPAALAHQNDFDADGCSLSTDKLVAMMLPIIWYEGGNGPNSEGNFPAGSPMVLSRGDNDPDLYWPGHKTSNPRAFWHPGIGLWQMDDKGMGRSIGVQRFSAVGSANKVAKVIAYRYCKEANQTFSPEKIWDGKEGPWLACWKSSLPCDEVYRDIWQNGELRNLGTTAKVGVLGGTKNHDCRWRWPTGGGTYEYSRYFTCFYVKPANAEGDNTAWWQVDKDGSGGAPLAKPFYVFRITDPEREVRFWTQADQTWGSTLEVRRNYDVGSRGDGNLKWYTTATLCDQDRTDDTCN
jgi:hypothetical protein